MHCMLSKKTAVRKADKLMQLSYKHWVSSTNCYALAFRSRSVENKDEDFDLKEQ